MYESLMNDLDRIETRVTHLTQHYKNLFEKNLDLEKKVESLKKENLILNQKISDLMQELTKFQQEGEINLFGSLNLKEKETLKNKLQELISRIDYHLSS